VIGEMDVSANTRVSRGERVFHGLAAALLAAVFLASFLGADRWRLWPVADGGREGNTLCVLRHLTGLPCMTCGMTRSFCALGRGQVGEALEQHPLGPVVYAVLAITMIRSAWIAAVGRRRLERVARMLVWSIPALALAALALWVLRLWSLFAGGAGAEAWHASPLARLLAGPG
jgi:hypothetical protein